jgi:hypothetical protein
MAAPDEDGFIAVGSRRKVARDPEPTSEGPAIQEAVTAEESAPNQDGTLKNRHTSPTCRIPLQQRQLRL